MSSAAALNDMSRILLWVAVPAAILGAVAAAAVKRAVLSRPRYAAHRPGLRTFVWVGLADLVAWGVLWPALVSLRLRGLGSGRALWTAALLLVVALGYIANRSGFGRALEPEVAGSLRGTLLAELLTVLMPVFAVVIGFALYLLLAALGV